MPLLFPLTNSYLPQGETHSRYTLTTLTTLIENLLCSRPIQGAGMTIVNRLVGVPILKWTLGKSPAQVHIIPEGGEAGRSH